jgi:hypothetical protein
MSLEFKYLSKNYHLNDNTIFNRLGDKTKSNYMLSDLSTVFNLKRNNAKDIVKLWLKTKYDLTDETIISILPHIELILTDELIVDVHSYEIEELFRGVENPFKNTANRIHIIFSCDLENDTSNFSKLHEKIGHKKIKTTLIDVGLKKEFKLDGSMITQINYDFNDENVLTMVCDNLTINEIVE